MAVPAGNRARVLVIDDESIVAETLAIVFMLKAQYPQVRVTLFSGRAATADLLEVARQQGHSFDVIAKPVHPSIFLEILASKRLHDGGQLTT